MPAVDAAGDGGAHDRKMRELYRGDIGHRRSARRRLIQTQHGITGIGESGNRLLESSIDDVGAKRHRV